jgi:hypothetical protein
LAVRHSGRFVRLATLSAIRVPIGRDATLLQGRPAADTNLSTPAEQGAFFLKLRARVTLWRRLCFGDMRLCIGLVLANRSALKPTERSTSTRESH